MIAHPPDRRLELIFFPVVIMIPHPPDRRLYLLLFSGRNNDCALARQTTSTFNTLLLYSLSPYGQTD